MPADPIAQLSKKTKLERDHLTAIGALAILWSEAEFQFQYLIWNIAGWPQATGELATADMGNTARLALLRNLVRRNSTDPTLIAQVDDIAWLFDELRMERNNLLHALIADEKTPWLSKRDAKQPLGRVRSVPVLSDLAHCLDLINYLDTFGQCAVTLALTNQHRPAGAPLRHLGETRATLAASRQLSRLRERLAVLRKRRSQRSQPSPS